MDKIIKNNSSNDIYNFTNNKAKNLKNNCLYQNSKQNINEIDDKFTSACNYVKTLIEISFNSSSNNKQNNNGILYNNLHSPIPNITVKQIIKNKNNSNSSSNLTKKKNIQKKKFQKINHIKKQLLLKNKLQIQK